MAQAPPRPAPSPPTPSLYSAAAPASDLLPAQSYERIPATRDNTPSPLPSTPSRLPPAPFSHLLAAPPPPSLATGLWRLLPHLLVLGMRLGRLAAQLRQSGDGTEGGLRRPGIATAVEAGSFLQGRSESSRRPRRLHKLPWAAQQSTLRRLLSSLPQPPPLPTPYLRHRRPQGHLPRGALRKPRPIPHSCPFQLP